jgi:molybdopterin converting factor small subunit
VFTDGEDVRNAQGTETRLTENAVVLVLPSVAGG